MKARYVFDKSLDINPVDRNKIYLQVNYDNEAIIAQQLPQVGIKNLRFAREDVSKFYNHIKNSNQGVFYAPTFDIELSKAGEQYTVPMYFDLTDGLKYSKEGIECAIKLYRSLDWLNDRVDGFTYESFTLNPLTPQDIAASNYIKLKTFYVPYVVSTKPDNISAFMGLLTVITVGLALSKEYDYIASYFLPNAANPFTSIPLFVGLVAHIVYATALLITIVSTIEMFVTSIIQPIKYHAVVLLRDLIIAACLELGLDFDSSIFDQHPFNKVAYLAEKNSPVSDGNSNRFSIASLFSIDYIVGGYHQPTPSKQVGYPIATGGHMLRLAKKLCNGKLLIQDVNGVPTLKLERRDYNPSTPQYQLPEVRQDWNGYNTREFFATTIIKFQKDLNDKNLSDFYLGSVLSAVTSPITAPDPLLVLTKNERTIEIPASRGIRKETLTTPEVLINAVQSVINAVATVIQGIINGVVSVLNAIVDTINTIMNAIDSVTFGALDWHDINKIPEATFANELKKINDRIGCLLLENDFVNIPKLIMVDTDNAYEVNGQRVCKLHVENSSVINALYLWNHSYCIDSFIPVDPAKFPVYSDQQGNGNATPPAKLSDKGKHNQYTLWSPALAKSSDKNKVPLAFGEFNLLVNDNNFKDSNGNALIADSIDWYYEDGYMDLDYRKNEIYAENLQQSITLPNGS